MGDRYLITGVELGMLKAYAELKKDINAQKLLETVYRERCVFYSERDIKKDVDAVSNIMSHEK